jgi:hypothetical protein
MTMKLSAPWGTEMNEIVVENDLEFDFRSALSVRRFDGQNHGMSHELKAIDFIVEWPDEIWWVEVKDPENSRIPRRLKTRQLKNFVEKMKSKKLIQGELAPKLKDTLIYLGLHEGISDRPLKYMVVLGVSNLDPAIFSPFLTALNKACLIPGPNGKWSKGFDVLAFNVASWNARFTASPISRLGVA